MKDRHLSVQNGKGTSVQMTTEFTGDCARSVRAKPVSSSDPCSVLSTFEDGTGWEPIENEGIVPTIKSEKQSVGSSLFDESKIIQGTIDKEGNLMKPINNKLATTYGVDEEGNDILHDVGYEICPHCGEENELYSFGIHKCSGCGKYIVACVYCLAMDDSVEEIECYKCILERQAYYLNEHVKKEYNFQGKFDVVEANDKYVWFTFEKECEYGTYAIIETTTDNMVYVGANRDNALYYWNEHCVDQEVTK